MESVFGDDSEPVCGNGSGMSGSLIKLLSFFGKQIQQGSLESPGWILVVGKEVHTVIGLDGGRRIQLKFGVDQKKNNNWRFPTRSCGDENYSRSCSVQYRTASFCCSLQGNQLSKNDEKMGRKWGENRSRSAGSRDTLYSPSCQSGTRPPDSGVTDTTFSLSLLLTSSSPRHNSTRYT